MLARHVAPIPSSPRHALGFESRESAPQMIAAVRQAVGETLSFERAELTLQPVLGHVLTSRPVKRFRASRAKSKGSGLFDSTEERHRHQESRSTLRVEKVARLSESCVLLLSQLRRPTCVPSLILTQNPHSDR
jgi:hypothetical protein